MVLRKGLEVRLLGWTRVGVGEEGGLEVTSEVHTIPDGTVVVVATGGTVAVVATGGTVAVVATGGTLQVQFRRYSVRVVAAQWDAEDIGNLTPTRITLKNWRGSLRSEHGKLRNGQ
jgi:L-asparaginase/Glu-tRNA(Gln) amidotransferase subunit D